jgi:hypothetical protein
MSIYLKNNTKKQEKVELALRNKGYGGNKKDKTWFDACWIGFKYILHEGNDLKELKSNLKKVRIILKEQKEAEEYIIKRIEEETNKPKEKKKHNPILIRTFKEAISLGIQHKNINVQQHWYGEVQKAGYEKSFSEFIEVLIKNG